MSLFGKDLNGGRWNTGVGGCNRGIAQEKYKKQLLNKKAPTLKHEMEKQNVWWDGQQKIEMEKMAKQLRQKFMKKAGNTNIDAVTLSRSGLIAGNGTIPRWTPNNFRPWPP